MVQSRFKDIICLFCPLYFNSKRIKRAAIHHQTPNHHWSFMNCLCIDLYPHLVRCFQMESFVKSSLLPRSNSRVGNAMSREMVFRKVNYKSEYNRVREQKFSLHEKIQLSEVNNGIEFYIIYHTRLEC